MSFIELSKELHEKINIAFVAGRRQVYVFDTVAELIQFHGGNLASASTFRVGDLEGRYTVEKHPNAIVYHRLIVRKKGGPIDILILLEFAYQFGFTVAEEQLSFPPDTTKMWGCMLGNRYEAHVLQHFPPQKVEAGTLN
jgi:hypothetical protein